MKYIIFYSIIASVFIFVTGCTQQKTLYKSPSTKSGNLCVSNCENILSSCQQACEDRKSTCEARQAFLNLAANRTNDVAPNLDCPILDCGCKDNYNICYQGCGGKVTNIIECYSQGSGYSAANCKR